VVPVVRCPAAPSSCPFRSFALAATDTNDRNGHEFETGVRAAEKAAGENAEAAR
jgi:hypothetical protein